MPGLFSMYGQSVATDSRVVKGAKETRKESTRRPRLRELESVKAKIEMAIDNRDTQALKKLRGRKRAIERIMAQHSNG